MRLLSYRTAPFFLYLFLLLQFAALTECGADDVAALTRSLDLAADFEPSFYPGNEVQAGVSVGEKVAPDRNDVQKGGTKAAIDDGSGAFKFSVALTLPPGINGFAPSLSLDYASSAALNSLVGAGFRLSTEDCITRRGPALQVELLGKTFPKGLPTFSDNDTFLLNGQRLASCDLKSGGPDAACPSGTYRVLRDDHAKVEKLAAQNGFRVSLPDGTVKEYLHNKALLNLYQGGQPPTDFQHQVKFCLSKIMHDGNSLEYFYRDSADSPRLELDRIDYGGQSSANHRWRVKFHYEARPAWDVRQSFSSGSQELLDSRLSAIEIIALPSMARVRKTKIQYFQGNYGERYSFVEKIQECGTNDSECDHPYQFSYNAEGETGWQGDGWQSATRGLTAANALVAMGNYPIPGTSIVSEEQVTLGTSIIDLNRDGYPDLVRNDDQLGPKVFLNNKNATWSEDANWSAKFQGLPRFFVGTLPRMQDNGVRFLDLNADGHPDLVRAVNAPANTEVWLWNPNLGNGGGFDNTLGRGFRDALRDQQIYFSKYSASNSTPTGVFTQDLNADGLVDILVFDSIAQRREVLLNTGSSFVGDPGWTFPADHSQPCSGYNPVWPFRAESSLVQSFQSNLGLQFADLNGDGLVDITQMFYIDPAVDACVMPGESRYRFGVWFNTGRGWSKDLGSTANLSASGALANVLQVDGQVPDPSHEPPLFFMDYIVNSHRGTQLVDLNGDGSDDIYQRWCKEVTQAGQIDCSETRALLTTPQSSSVNFTRDSSWEWGTLATSYFITRMFRPINLSGGGSLARTSIDQDGTVRLIDLNKDGLPDLLGNRIASNGVQQGLVELNKLDIARNLINYIQNPLGGETSVNYMLADGTPGTLSASPELNTPKIVVRSVSENNGEIRMRYGGEAARHKVYDYKNGKMDRIEREFAGFASVLIAQNSTPENVSHSQIFFRNTESDRCVFGKIVESRECDAFTQGECLPSLRTTQWSYPACQTEVDGPFSLKPSEVRSFERDPVVSLFVLSSKQSFEYDLFGNTIATYDYYSAQDTLPYRLNWSIYNSPNQNGPWVSDRLCQRGFVDKSGGMTRELWAEKYFYDGASLFNPSCANITSGRITRKERVDRVIAAEDPGASLAVEEFSYTAAGNLATQKDARGFTSSTNWNSSLAEILPLSTTDKLGHSSTYSYDQFGNPYTSIDANGVRHEVRYDGAHRPRHSWSEKSGVKASETWFDYFPALGTDTGLNDVGVTTTTALDSGRTLVQRNVIDGLGNQIFESSISGQSCLSVATLYDGAGRVLRKSEPYSSCQYDVTPGSKPFTEHFYDQFGRVIQTTIPGGYTYYQTYQLGYRGPAILMHQIRYGSGLVPQFKMFDSAGRLAAVAECEGDGCYDCVAPFMCNDIISDTPGTKLTTYHYDAAENLIGVILPGDGSVRLRDFYDGNGRVIATKDPNLSNCQDSFIDDRWSGCPARLGYDAQGNLTSKTSAQYALDPSLGTYSQISYDALARVRTKTIYRGDRHVFFTFGYDTDYCGEGGSAISRLTSQSYSDPYTGERTSELFCYDKFGNLSSKKIESTIPGAETGPAEQIFRYQYYLNGLLKRKTLPDGEALSFDYDGYGRPKSLLSSQLGSIVSNTTYSSEGRKATLSLGNGLIYQFGYRIGAPNTPAGDRKLSSISVSALANHAPMSLQFDYDPLGNITTVTNSLDLAKSESYQYDSLSRLKNFLGSALEQFDYDALGNRTGVFSYYLWNSVQPAARSKSIRLSRQNSTSSSYLTASSSRASELNLENAPESSFTHTYYGYGKSYSGQGGPNALKCVGMNALSPCQGALQTYTYDVDGRTTRLNDIQSGITHTYSYDLEGRVSKVQLSGASVLSTRYFYAASGAKIADLDAGTVTFYLDSDYELRNGAAVKHYIFDGQRIARRDGSAALKYLMTDQLGSLRAEFSNAREYLAHRDYLPFGGQSFASGTINTDRGFNGNAVDVSGLYDYGARHYLPNFGRFLQPDTIVPKIDLPQSFNRYSYVLNNPLRFVDPSGHEPAESDEQQQGENTKGQDAKSDTTLGTVTMHGRPGLRGNFKEDKTSYSAYLPVIVKGDTVGYQYVGEGGVDGGDAITGLGTADPLNYASMVAKAGMIAAGFGTRIFTGATQIGKGLIEQEVKRALEGAIGKGGAEITMQVGKEIAKSSPEAKTAIATGAALTLGAAAVSHSNQRVQPLPVPNPRAFQPDALYVAQNVPAPVLRAPVRDAGPYYSRGN